MKKFARPLAVLLLFASVMGCGAKPREPNQEATADVVPTGKVEGRLDAAQPEMTFQIRQYSWDGHPGNRGDAIRVWLDRDRLLAYDLSQDDLMTALTPSGTVDPQEPPPLPGVVFVSRLRKPDQYENIVLKANAEGEIVRLKDVAKVEWLSGSEAQQADPNAASDGRGPP